MKDNACVPSGAKNEGHEITVETTGRHQAHRALPTWIARQEQRLGPFETIPRVREIKAVSLTVTTALRFTSDDPHAVV